MVLPNSTYKDFAILRSPFCFQLQLPIPEVIVKPYITYYVTKLIAILQPTK